MAIYKYAVEVRINRPDGTKSEWLRYFYSKTKQGAEDEKAWSEKHSHKSSEYRVVKNA